MEPTNETNENQTHGSMPSNSAEKSGGKGWLWAILVVIVLVLIFVLGGSDAEEVDLPAEEATEEVVADELEADAAVDVEAGADAVTQ